MRKCDILKNVIVIDSLAYSNCTRLQVRYIMAMPKVRNQGLKYFSKQKNSVLISFQKYNYKHSKMCIV